MIIYTLISGDTLATAPEPLTSNSQHRTPTLLSEGLGEIDHKLCPFSFGYLFVDNSIFDGLFGTVTPDSLS
jgi:hypothetical protein